MLTPDRKLKDSVYMQAFESQLTPLDDFKPDTIEQDHEVILHVHDIRS